MKLHLLILLTALLGWSCGSRNGDTAHNHHDHAGEETGNSPTATLESEVLAIHDSVMPRMSDLMRLKKAVSARVDQTAQSAEKKRGLAIRRQLDEADRAMMDWMHQYRADTLGKLSEAKATEYLRAEKAKIERVQTQMFQSISRAEAYVKTQP